ncbi:MAG: hypothetical protein ACTSYR_02595 [Candidatus Odinarchaeia archaeon]
MSQEVLDEINKKMEEMVEGRRYIIRQVGSLKVSIEELIEKLETTGVSGGGETDLTAITPLLEALNQEINKLRETQPEQLEGTLNEFRKSIMEVKNLITALKDEISKVQTSEVEVDLSEISRKIDEIKENITTKIEGITRKVDELDEKIMNLEGLKDAIDKIENIEGLFDKLSEIEKKISEMQSIEQTISTQEMDNLKEIVNKLTTIVLDLKAEVESTDESLNYGLKIIEENLKNELKGITTERITCKEEAINKIRKAIEEDQPAIKVYDSLLDLLYHTKKENRFDEKIHRILELIKKIRSLPENEPVADSLKEELLTL